MANPNQNQPTVDKTVPLTATNLPPVVDTTAASTATVVAPTIASTPLPDAKTAPISTTVPTSVNLQPTPVVTDYQKFIQDVKTKGSESARLTIEALEIYIGVMDPAKPVDSQTGARQQYNLWRTINMVITRIPTEDFNEAWNIILATFAEHRFDVFAERYVFRFPDEWANSKEDFILFNSLLNLILETCDSAKRKEGLKNINLDKVLGKIQSDEGRNRLGSFYI